ncbi:receptor-like protein EIX2 [Gossypium hirsutum]|uniref:Receptor-like protein EIX2 n=1 Tax=Gossypium hirsutum TaxID=3635 RepID=A0A1U8J6C4_GOSHI|nr:receptor-like protein EIX2 [Gossypium hirsutum]
MSSRRLFQLLVLFLGLFLRIKFANGFNLSAREDRILCKDKERQALLALKQSLVDDHGLLSSWGIRDCCQWKGVGCNQRTKLDLRSSFSDEPLRGTINPSLLQLQHLNFLYLSDNDFGSSQFPDFNGSLSRLSSNHVGENSWLKLVNKLPLHLENLQLRSCGLHGTILSQPLNGSFASPIRVINLSRKRLSSSSALKWLTNISSNLAELNLEYNNLIQASIPGIFRNMASLQHLYLTDNQLGDGIQGFIGNICTLKTLDPSRNNLTGLFPRLPPCIESSLEIFNLDWNSLQEGFSLASSNCSKLVFLVLDGNQLTGPLPNFCNNAFMSLEELDISHNRFNGTVTESLGCLSRLKHLLASRNSMGGIISKTLFENLTELLSLDLSLNHLTLNFRSDWVAPFRLRHLSLSFCKVGPYFPKWLQAQNDLQHLDISGAGISDTIPAWLWDTSPYLYFLNLSNNQMSGILSDLLSPNTLFITEMDLSSNMSDGPLPLLPYINVLNLVKNRFTGSLDPVCKITSKYLTFLEVSGNLLSGELSECLFQLLVLNLDNNNFSGEIPTSLGSLFSLKALNLHNNSFSGEIPLSLKDCSNLNLFGPKHLQANDFNGRIPANFCRLAHMQILDQSQNSISGTIPSCLNNLTAMAQKRVYTYGGGRIFEVIDLSSNKLTGEIPNEITSLFELVAPNLSRNGLTGLIPHNINQLKQLESLDLSENHLSGRIPVTMADLTFLSYLDLSYNNLSGRIPSSTKLQTFDASAFVGNRALCGSQITVQCTEDDTNLIKPDHNKLGNGDEFRNWFYAGMGVGFWMGFWGVFTALL